MTASLLALPLGLPAETLIAVLIGLVTLVNVVVMWRSLIEDRPRATRVRAIARRRLEVPAGGGRRAQARPQAKQAALERLLKRLQGLRNARSEQLSERLLRAGLRAGHAAGLFLLAKLACPLLLAVALWLFILVLGGTPSGAAGLLLTAAALSLGLFLPDLYLANRATKRRQALQASLPDGLDLLVICAEAGLTLDVALVRVSEELARTSPELADELAITSVELNFLPDRRQALANLARRGDLPALRGVVNALTQTERYGTPLAQALRVLAAELRDQRMLRAEERAARLPALLTVPMIVFILPTLFIVLIGPALLGVLTQMAG